MRDKKTIIEDKELDIENLLNAKKRLEQMINDVSDCEYADDLRTYLDEDMKELELIIAKLKADIEDAQEEEVSEELARIETAELEREYWNSQF